MYKKNLEGNSNSQDEEIIPDDLDEGYDEYEEEEVIPWQSDKKNVFVPPGKKMFRESDHGSNGKSGKKKHYKDAKNRYLRKHRDEGGW
jgi:hypothetical protein